jgi:dipeptidyl aminopeptidase/acylaminoacyl peptidase
MIKRKLKVEDLRRFKFISDPQISPDGETIAFVLSTINYEEDKYERHIWMLDIKSGELSQFTHGQCIDTYPRWSPDGSKLLFFSSGRQTNKKNQLYQISRNGGEAFLIAETEEGIRSAEWAQDSENILFLSRVWTEDKPENTDVKRIKRIKYKRNGVGFIEGRRIHLFTVRDGIKPIQLTDGEYDIDTATWCPTGEEIAFVTNMEPDADTSKIRDIYKVKLEPEEPRKITGGIYSITGIQYSPNGEYIAFSGSDEPDKLSGDYNLFLSPSNGGNVNCLTKNFNRSLLIGVGSDLRVCTHRHVRMYSSKGFTWSSDGESILFNTADIPYSNIYKLHLDTMEIHTMVTDKVVDSFSISKDNKIAFNAMKSTEPSELYLIDEKEEKLTNFNKQLLDQLVVIEPEHFTFTNRLGREVDGWVIKPVNWKKGEKYPCILEMHGGPRAVYGDAIYQEFQLLCAEGYAVIYTNPRGSAGYEESYTMAVMGHYGEVDYEDFMDFTDKAIELYPWIDQNRLGLTGGSYGGYTTNWIITQTNRFKAAVTFRSICNWVSKFGVSDIGFMQPEWISGAKTYWGQNLIQQIKHSPIYHVGNVKTPCLIVHSEQDYTCPMAEAEQWFTALKLNNVPTELVRFPDENHNLSRSGKPKHREERFQHMLRWFREYL